MKIRGLTHDDLPTVLEVQRHAYQPELLESIDTFTHKLSLFPNGCLGSFEGHRLAGYAFSHPWRLGKIVPLDEPLAELPQHPDCFYIHDLAVHSDYRGRGVASSLLHDLFARAADKGLRQFALVAVQHSEPFWSRFGFKRRRSILYAPGVRATYMTLTGQHL